MELRLAPYREPVAERLRRAGPAIVLVAVAGACWAITASRMRGMDMGPGTDLGSIGWFAGVWVTMMAAMMLPSVVPMALAHARAGRRSGGSRQGAGSAVFGLGYLLSWLAAGVVAYGVFDGVGSLGIPWLAWDRGGRYLAAGVILAAALYELTPAKRACLRQCRDPALVSARWRPGLRGALRTGLEHGGFCVGSSWALMAVLFAVGVMNVTWMIVLAGAVAIEKLLPSRGVAVGATTALLAALAFGVAFVPAHVPWLTSPM